ncbi:hypothetical protein CTA2_5053 [Colletotrichum tanaceti]|nr:hypothetical protein CTA2_5053 [Colletotrichum tanaceti]
MRLFHVVYLFIESPKENLMMSKPGQFRADLPELARHLLTNGPHKSQPASRRVRVMLNRTYIVDTTKAVHVWEHVAYPQYYVPTSELRNCSWEDKQGIPSPKDAFLGAAAAAAAHVVQVTVPGSNGGESVTTDRALRFSEDEALSGAFRGMVRLEFGSMGKVLRAGERCFFFCFLLV